MGGWAHENHGENLAPLLRPDGRYLIFGAASDIGYPLHVYVMAMCDVTSDDEFRRFSSRADQER